MNKIFILLSLLLISFSCSHSVHLVNLSDHSLKLDQSKGRKIEIETKQHVWLGFAFDTNYVDQAKEKLINLCPGGSIKNITTRYSTSHGFFNWYNKIYMQGYCFKKG